MRSKQEIKEKALRKALREIDYWTYSKSVDQSEPSGLLRYTPKEDN